MPAHAASPARNPVIARDECRNGYGAAPGRVARQPRGAFRRGALTTDLQLTSAHWLVALAKSSSQRAAQAHSEALAAATHAFSGSALGRDH